jgi:uncharacterized protein YcfJ
MTHHFHRSLLAATLGLALAAPALAQITLYRDDNFQGRSITTRGAMTDFTRQGFNDRASSAVVTSQRWEICENSNYGGTCRVLRPGQYPSLSAMGLNDRVSSVRQLAGNRRIADDRYAPPPQVAGDFRRRNQERLYEAQVTAVRAVYGASTQRCWMEREEVARSGMDPRAPGAVLGAVLGGILGHQIGGGTGRDIATVGGVVAGAVVGGKISGDRSDNRSETREVQRCTGTPASNQPVYWDVTYMHRGQEHHVQLTSAPGATVTVNRQGEPRAS